MIESSLSLRLAATGAALLGSTLLAGCDPGDTEQLTLYATCERDQKLNITPTVDDARATVRFFCSGADEKISNPRLIRLSSNDTELSALLAANTDNSFYEVTVYAAPNGREPLQPRIIDETTVAVQGARKLLTYEHRL